MLAVNGLYGHIQHNALKSGMLLGSFVLLIGVFWYAWCVIFVAVIEAWGPQVSAPKMAVVPAVKEILVAALDAAIEGWWLPLVFSSLWFVAAWFVHADLIRAATRARPLTRKEAPRLYNLIENLAISAGIPMPRVEIMRTSALNAYAAGLGPDDAVVAVTQGLLNTLSDDELEAVLAHEITHIRNHDVRLMVVAAVFTGGLTLIGQSVGRAFSGSRTKSGDDTAFPSLDIPLPSGKGDDRAAMLPVLIAIAIAVLLLAATHVLALLSQFAISRSREFMADAGAVELTKNPDALISALSKISGHDEIPGLNRTVRAMMISANAEALFATHPRVADRINALQIFAGGRKIARRLRPAQASSGAGLAASPGHVEFVGGRASFGRRKAQA